nr:hypothetical protein [Tanacetum cinerariifolium]
DHHLSHSLCSKLVGFSFSRVKGVVEGEEGDYPLDFEGFAGENEGKKGCVGLAGKG